MMEWGRNVLFSLLFMIFKNTSNSFVPGGKVKAWTLSIKGNTEQY